MPTADLALLLLFVVVVLGALTATGAGVGALYAMRRVPGRLLSWYVNFSDDRALRAEKLKQEHLKTELLEEQLRNEQVKTFLEDKHKK